MIQRTTMHTRERVNGERASSSNDIERTDSKIKGYTNGKNSSGLSRCWCWANKGVFTCTLVTFIVASLIVVYLLDVRDNSCDGRIWVPGECLSLRRLDRQSFIQNQTQLFKTQKEPPSQLQINESSHETSSDSQSVPPLETQKIDNEEEAVETQNRTEDAHQTVTMYIEEQELHEYRPGCYNIHPLQQNLIESEIVHENDTKHLAGIITHHRMGTQMFSNMLFLYADRIGLSYQLTIGSQNLGGGTKPDFQTVRLLSDTRLVSAQHGMDECCHINPQNQCELFNVTCKMEACELIQPPKFMHWTIVHVVRNPVEIIMSSYLYHNQEEPPEPWLHKTKPELMPYLFPDDEERQKEFADQPYYKILNQVEPAIGLRAEILVNLEELLMMCTNYRDVLKLPHAKNFRFEDIMSDVVGESTKILTFLGIVRDDIVPEDVDRYLKKNFQLSTLRSDQKGEALAHVTEGKFNKTEIAELMYLQDDLRQVLQEMGNLVGYEDPFERLHRKSA